MSTTFAEVFFPSVHQTPQLAEVLKIMCRSKAWTPAKYGENEPIRTVFDANEIEVMAERLLPLGTIYWKGGDGFSNGALSLGQGRGKKTASLSIWTDLERLNDTSDLSRVIHEVSARFGASYGFVHYLSEPERKRLSGSDTIMGNENTPHSLMISRWQLVRCLPNLYWANVFGPEYVTLFGGRDRVASAPAAIVKELAPDTFYIQLTENMLDFASRHAEVDELRERVKKHLGADCFFDYETRFNGRYRVPNLGWEEPSRPPITAESLMELKRGRS